MSSGLPSGVEFSSPMPEELEVGWLAFPLSVELLRHLFAGLFWELAIREICRGGLNLRALDRLLLALGGNGVARGDGDITLEFDSRLALPARL